jgi:D-serine deaminase-like pyridoxal phosphate-dependent protein
MRIADLDTPALLIDVDVMERNLCRVAAYAREHGLRLRPHTKTHKIPALGRRQVELGAAGLTVAKVGEAEVMAASGTPDLLVAYPVLGPRKLARLMALPPEMRITVALDSLEAGRELSQAAVAAKRKVGVLAEIDVGLGRVGVPPEQGAALAQALAGLPGLEFEGIAFYPGHVKLMDEAGARAIAGLSEVLAPVLDAVRRAGLDPKVVSGGSTPALFQSHLAAGMNEIRPGTYIFNDRNTVVSRACAWDDCAATVLCTVVSTAVAGQMVVDGGSKTFSSDRLSASPEVSFGHVIEAPGAVFTRMNEEHGYIDVRNAGRKFAVGDTVRIVPNHVCTAMNLHEQVYSVRGDDVVSVWKVEGRGKLQ